MFSFQKADLAVCDLTITYERRRAVDFTMPFMTLGNFFLRFSILCAFVLKQNGWIIFPLVLKFKKKSQLPKKIQYRGKNNKKYLRK